MGRTCFNCSKLRYGWIDDSHPHAYTCEREPLERIFLLDITNMTPAMIYNELGKIASSCENFESNEEDF